MKVMWLTTMILPSVAKALQKLSAAGSGGWVMTMLEELSKSADVEAIDVVTISNVKEKIAFQLGKIRYAVLPSSDGEFNHDTKLHLHINEELSVFQPDVIDVHGIEFFLCKSLLETRTNIPIVATLQGLTCEIHKHYLSGIPVWELLRNRTLRDNLMLDGIIERKYRYKRRGRNEIEVLQKLQNVLGRTEWDRAVSTSINPNICYFTCNRILRDEFYSAQWNLGRIDRHSLFMTQAHYPIKGLHILLKALMLLVGDFPKIKLYVAGKDLLSRKSLREKLAFSGYQRYIERLIKQYRLGDNIVFTGRLQAEEIVNRLQRTHVFVLPSMIENSPNALAEAQMVGVPSVAALVGGVGDYIQDGITGMLYNSNEPIMLAAKIRKIFVDDDLAVKLSTNGKGVAIKRHDKVTNFEQLTYAYETIIISQLNSLKVTN